MRLIEWAIVGALIFLPFATVNRIEVETQRKALLTELRYNAALDAAVDDAARMLTVNTDQRRETQYESAKRVALNKDEAIAAFFSDAVRKLRHCRRSRCARRTGSVYPGYCGDWLRRFLRLCRGGVDGSRREHGTETGLGSEEAVCLRRFIGQQPFVHAGRFRPRLRCGQPELARRLAGRRRAADEYCAIKGCGAI